MRISPWIDKLNVTINLEKLTPGQPYWQLRDLFTTRDGSWEVKDGVEYGIPQWARDTYLKAWGAPDYFDDAGADHHIFGAVYDPVAKTLRKTGAIRYWTWGDNGNQATIPVKAKSGWANIPMTGKYFPDQKQIGPYAWRPDTTVSADVVKGAGMPYNLHVSFFAVWEIATVVAPPTDPTLDQRIVRLQEWARAWSKQYPEGPQYV